VTDVEIEWNGVSVHRGRFTVPLTGGWARDRRWVAIFNQAVPPVSPTSWGQIATKPSTAAGWSEITAKADATIIVQRLHPGNAKQLKETLEKLVAHANATMASLVVDQQRTEPQRTQLEAELDSRDKAIMDEFRQVTS
jgi:hypothetical protein